MICMLNKQLKKNQVLNAEQHKGRSMQTQSSETNESFGFYLHMEVRLSTEAENSLPSFFPIVEIVDVGIIRDNIL